ncbi:SDR family NAD(P)-dependent oxidoreductase [Streptomyces sp. NBC_01762]|uniref:SDR family NAD(P)-dependent oxidoreductase n=1 Tax=Streptomyces sp. NBC_01762 TaxID=2975933 RepID=UPI003FA34C12
MRFRWQAWPSGAGSVRPRHCARLSPADTGSHRRATGRHTPRAPPRRAGAAVSFTRTWAVESGGSGVRINAVAPGHTKTDNVVDMIGEEDLEQLGARVALGRLASVREIAEAIVFLASSRAGYITGVTLAVDGGFMALGVADI